MTPFLGQLAATASISASAGEFLIAGGLAAYHHYLQDYASDLLSRSPAIIKTDPAKDLTNTTGFSSSASSAAAATGVSAIVIPEVTTAASTSSASFDFSDGTTNYNSDLWFDPMGGAIDLPTATGLGYAALQTAISTNSGEALIRLNVDHSITF